MPTTKSSSLLAEIAEFFASSPTPQQVLNFRPSEQIQELARELLLKQNAGLQSEGEEKILRQFEQMELLMQMVKAKTRLRIQRADGR